MRDVNGGDAKLALDAANLGAQFDANFCVEGGERFVEKKQLRLNGDGASEGDALLLPAGKLIGVAVSVIRQMDQVEHFTDALLDFIF